MDAKKSLNKRIASWQMYSNIDTMSLHAIQKNSRQPDDPISDCTHSTQPEAKKVILI